VNDLLALQGRMVLRDVDRSGSIFHSPDRNARRQNFRSDVGVDRVRSGGSMWLHRVYTTSRNSSVAPMKYMISFRNEVRTGSRGGSHASGRCTC